MSPKPHDPAQLALVQVDDPADQVDDAPRPGRRSTGRHERALNRAARESGLDRQPVMAAAVSAARSVAWALDRAEAKGNPYAIAQLAKPYQELLDSLGLLPTDKADDDDALGDLDGPT